MFSTRFIRVKIYNSAGTEVEYDNKYDTNWGIAEGTMSLDKILMENELKYGKLNSSKFEIQVFGIDVDLSNRKIEVIATDTFEEGTSTTTQTSYLFAGWVESSEKDYFSTDRVIVAYDWIYYHRDDNIADWWNNFWNPSGSLPVTSTTLYSLKSSLLYNLGLSSSSQGGGALNDSVSVTNTFANGITTLTVATILEAICVLQNVTPTMTDFDRITFVRFNTTVAHDLTDNTEGVNSKWEDYTTNTITGIGVYDTSNELAQLYGTSDNVYKIVGNIFLLDMTASEINAVCQPLLDDLATISYTPAELKCIVSDFTYKLGEYIESEHGYTYIMESHYDGSILVEQTVKGSAVSENLSNDVEDLNDDLINGTKYARIKHDIDEFTIDYGNFKRDTEATLSVLEDEIVLKVNIHGQLVEVMLGEDPDSSGATIFKVDADNISFFANNSMQLTANHLGIYSTNFQVDEYGNVIANSLTAQNEGNTFTTIIDTDEMKIVNNEDDDVYVSIEAESWNPPSGEASYTSGKITISDGDDYLSYITSRDLYIKNVNPYFLNLMGPYHQIISYPYCGTIKSLYNDDTERYSGHISLLGEEADILINDFSIKHFMDGEPFYCDYRGTGFITTNASKVWFTIPLPKSAYGKLVTCVDFVGRIRVDGKYIHGTHNSMTTIVATANVTSDNYSLQVALTKGVNSQQQLIPYGNKKKLNNRVVGIDVDGTFIFNDPIPEPEEEEE